MALLTVVDLGHSLVGCQGAVPHGNKPNETTGAALARS
jgi:hypothetical protein